MPATTAWADAFKLVTHRGIVGSWNSASWDFCHRRLQVCRWILIITLPATVKLRTEWQNLRVNCPVNLRNATHITIHNSKQKKHTGAHSLHHGIRRSLSHSHSVSLSLSLPVSLYVFRTQAGVGTSFLTCLNLNFVQPSTTYHVCLYHKPPCWRFACILSLCARFRSVFVFPSRMLAATVLMYPCFLCMVDLFSTVWSPSPWHDQESRRRSPSLSINNSSKLWVVSSPK